ncbi:hypothetical protein NONO_c60090 [Nocardia nova SH22a]|uniref:Uncharacterized protein n=1 Tax=Nocardia nova SH22a TaxID=1415166 RepID=W5TN52_9NOCA|nr:hypothetical protein [Nocardia nova]AHH20785.1 hypothetical protein NONO_c60090 [Nocardia nova SH22a]
MTDQIPDARKPAPFSDGDLREFATGLTTASNSYAAVQDLSTELLDARGRLDEVCRLHAKAADGLAQARGWAAWFAAERDHIYRALHAMETDRNQLRARVSELSAGQGELIRKLSKASARLCELDDAAAAAGAAARGGLFAVPAPEPAPCPTCNGAGRVANTDDQEPWSAWSNLPPGSDAAVRLGLVRPIPCPTCNSEENDRG